MTNMYPVIILAGGLATRLRPVTQVVPKALVDLNGEPFVVHQLRLLQSQGVQEVLMCVGFLGEQIVEAIGNGRKLGLDVSYSFDGTRLLGTAGAIKQALSKLGSKEFFVLYGDSYLECDYDAVQAAFCRSGKKGLMTVFRNDKQWDQSNVEFQDGRIVAYDKKKDSDRMRHIDYGLSVFRKEAFDVVPEGEPHELVWLFQKLLQRDQLAAFEVHNRFYEIGSPSGLRETQEYLAKKLNRNGAEAWTTFDTI